MRRADPLQRRVWAREVGELGVGRKHELCMQLDGHVDFNGGYYVSMMLMRAMAVNEYGVLSTYGGNIVQDLTRRREVLHDVSNVRG